MTLSYPKAVMVLAGILLAVSLTRCGRQKDNTLYPWGWEALGRPTDSLMVTLQGAFLGDASLDSCLRLVNRFHQYSDNSEALPIEKARAIFWDARLAFASENYDEARELFSKSLSVTDSAEYPYDARYLRLCLEPLEGKVLDGSHLDWEWYRLMLDDLDYAMKHDARVFGGIRAQYLSCIMTYSGNPSRALHYALIADSLFTGVGRDGDRLTNRLNVASNRILVGDTAGAMKDYAWMQSQLENGIEPVSPRLRPLIDYNRWMESHDTTALVRLREQSRFHPDLKGYDALASAYLAGIEMDHGRIDSLAVRIDDMEAGVDFSDDASQKAFVLKMLARSYETLGRKNEAMEYLKTYTQVAEENVASLSNDNYSVAETERQIGELEHSSHLERLEIRIKLIVITLLFVVLLVVVSVAGYRWIHRLNHEKKVRVKELEKAKRSELSMSLSVKEKERQLDELRQKISRLVDIEMIDTDAAREIESSLRSEAGASKADEEFGAVFSQLSPDFSRRLSELYPRIGRNTLRMAQYIAIGMDNRHIARVMNIRPESVKQNRWRLRSALGLDTDDNLDMILRDML